MKTLQSTLALASALLLVACGVDSARQYYPGSADPDSPDGASPEDPSDLQEPAALQMGPARWYASCNACGPTPRRRATVVKS